MNTSSASSRTSHSFNMPRHGWLAVLGLFSATALTTLCLALSNRDAPPSSAPDRGAERPLFSGWIKHGAADFGQNRAHTSVFSIQPKWVLATEPSLAEVKDLSIALAGHPDKDKELDRLVNYSRFQKQVALWNELQNGPMNSERASLGEHLLEVLPTHYSRGEVMAPQALLMAKALVMDLESDVRIQNERLAEAKSQLAKQAPTIAQEDLNAQKTSESFTRQQLPRIASDHDSTPHHVEARLDTARHALLDAGPLTETP